MDKPTKPTNLIPRSFGGVKNNFSEDLQDTGYEINVPAIYGGDNLNYQLDATGKELDYCEKICDYINAMPIGKTITTDENNKLVYDDLNKVGIATKESLGIVQIGNGVDVDDNGIISVNTIYKPFAINTGSTSNGKNNTLTYSGADITCAPCTITTADGRTKSFENGGTYSITTEGDGDYYIFKNFSTGALSLVREYEFAISNTYGQKNIARQNQTTSNFANNPQNAFDGDIDTYASTGLQITIANNAFIGQANVQKPIKLVKIRQGLSTVTICTSYKLQYSNDNGVTWNDIQTVTGGSYSPFGEAQSVPVNSYTPTGSFHRFRVLAVTFAGTQGSQGWAISEIEMYARTTYWLDTSASPAVLKVYDLATDTYSVNNDLVCIGQCSVASSVVTSITNNLFNDNGYSDGTATEGGFAMPSDTVYNYVVGASGSHYIAPANGYISASGNTNDTNAIIQMGVLSNYMGIISRYFSYGGDGYGARVQMPVKKGDVFFVRYSTSLQHLRFIYAIGSEREA